MKRREFLQYSTLATGSMFIPSFLKGMQFNQAAFNGKRLIIVQLGGGNDGLNTVVPYTNDIYYRLRPKLALRKDEINALTDELAFNKVMKGLTDLYDQGLVSVINNVGYPNPNRSHFRSMDIWQTGSASDSYLQSGWVGRYLDAQCNGQCAAHEALEIDSSLSLALKGKDVKGLAIEKINDFKKMTDGALIKSLSQEEDHNHEQVSYLYKTLRETVSSADYIAEKMKVYQSNIVYPFNAFGKKLKTLAQLINSGVESKVFYVSLTGFDTHAFQKNAQNNLLRQFSDGIKALVTDLKQNNNIDNTVIMAFSEFGRRVKQNGSNGTDHGAANNLFLISGGLKRPGFYNETPNLLDLDNGDIKHTVDFRQVYASLLDNWLHVDHQNILGEQFSPLHFV